MRAYITFTEGQVHKINGVRYDKDCVAMIAVKDIADGKRLAKELFNDRYEFVNSDAGFEWEINKTNFPRGVINVR